MEEQLYRLVYCSRNLLQGSLAEITKELEQILVSSRVNNQKAGITGALLYNDGMFAQALEGPLPELANVFEIIQRDPRHREIVVVQSGPSEKRDFPAWAMAFSGNPQAEHLPAATAAFRAAFAHLEDSGEQMLAVLRDLVVAEDDRVLLEVG